MSKIVIGTAHGKNIGFDTDLLLATRLLITADSGGGKSWLARVLFEQAFGKLQIIIIDPEGEFASLREKYPFVLAGKGGDTPVDLRSAGMLAHRLLKLRVSAICDLYEMKSDQRHIWVRDFFNALIEAPKDLRVPLLLGVDEFHIFAPEKGQGESEAKQASIDIATRGRKRGICLAGITQRLAMLDKNVTSQLQNRLVGPTFEEVNIKTAVRLLGIVPGKEEREFHSQIQLLEPGNFFALGRAISRERILIKVREVETAHPKAFEKHTAPVPPTPEKIKGLLPQLADLPQEAEQKARTEAEFKREIRELKQQLKAAEKHAPKPIASAAPARSSDPAQKQIIRQLRAALEAALKIIAKVQVIGFENAGLKPEDVAKAFEAASAEIVKVAQAKLGARAGEFGRLQREAASAIEKMSLLLQDEHIEVEVAVTRNEPFTVGSRSAPKPRRDATHLANGNGDLSGPEQKILKAMGELLSIGKDLAPVAMVAAWSGYSPQGGAFGNPRGALRSKGLIDYPEPGRMTLTESGRNMVGPQEPPDQDEIWRRIASFCTGPEVKILRALVNNAGADEMPKEQLAEKAGYSPVGGAFGNPIGSLRTKGLLDYPRQGVVKAADWLFAS
jgi:hypothetical protein